MRELLLVSPKSGLIPIFGMFFYIRILIAADGIVARQPFTQIVVRISLAWSSSIDAKSTLHRAGMISVRPCRIANSAAGHAVNS